MKSKVVSSSADQRTIIVVLETGEEAFATLTQCANAAGISGASLTAIGAFEHAVIGWFDIATKSYRKIRVDEQCEVLSALGDIATGDDGKASLHIHVVLGLSDGSTRGARGQGPADPRSRARGGIDRAAPAQAARARNRADRSRRRGVTDRNRKAPARAGAFC